jgi:hypothetical protein
LLGAKIPIVLHYRLNKWCRNKQFLEPVKQSNSSKPAGVRGECRPPPDASSLLKKQGWQGLAEHKFVEFMELHTLSFNYTQAAAGASAPKNLGPPICEFALKDVLYDFRVLSGGFAPLFALQKCQIQTSTSIKPVLELLTDHN